MNINKTINYNIKKVLLMREIECVQGIGNQARLN